MSYYLYIHRRPDTGEIFYVGRGKHYKRSTLYRRAYAFDGRNCIWHGIVNRNNGNFNVEILLECETDYEIAQMEREAIGAFGKIIDNTGSLCNMTDGGEGAEGYEHTEVAKNKMKLAHKNNPQRSIHFKSQEFKINRVDVMRMRGYKGSMFGKRHSNQAKQKMSEARKGEKHYAAKLVKDLQTGNIYGCVNEAAKAINIGKWSLYKMLSGERINHTSIRYENVV